MGLRGGSGIKADILYAYRRKVKTLEWHRGIG